MSDVDLRRASQGLGLAAQLAFCETKAPNYFSVSFDLAHEHFELIVLRSSGDREKQMAAVRAAVDRLGPVVEPVPIERADDE